ncbi:uncharacterized protein TRIREDRAFT_104939, partial [Trichoderma reesei QM6a]
RAEGYWNGELYDDALKDDLKAEADVCSSCVEAYSGLHIVVLQGVNSVEHRGNPGKFVASVRTRRNGRATIQLLEVRLATCNTTGGENNRLINVRPDHGRERHAKGPHPQLDNGISILILTIPEIVESVYDCASEGLVTRKCSRTSQPLAMLRRLIPFWGSRRSALAIDRQTQLLSASRGCYSGCYMYAAHDNAVCLRTLAIAREDPMLDIGAMVEFSSWTGALGAYSRNSEMGKLCVYLDGNCFQRLDVAMHHAH